MSGRGVAIVTGGRRGIGAGIAVELAKVGFNMLITDIERDDAANAVLASARAQGATAEFLVNDVADVTSHAAVIAAASALPGPLSCLVNNAGVTSPVRGDMMELTPESWDRVMAINLRGAFFLSQAFAKAMIAEAETTPEDGFRSIVNITSANAEILGPDRADYTMSKAAMSMMTRLLAARLAQHRVHSYEIRPGLILTEMTAQVADKNQAFLDKGGVPFGYAGTPGRYRSCRRDAGERRPFIHHWRAHLGGRRRPSAPALIRRPPMAKTLRARMAEGEVINNGWLSMPDTFGAELMAQSGWDSLTLDMQHGLIGYGEMVHILQTLHRFDLPVLVRTPWKDLATVSRCLDAGANGVIAPMINTEQEARDLVSASRFTPLGSRSHGPVRAAAYGTGGTYYKTANSEILVLAMIETPEGVANLDAILAVDGIDGVFIGPGDFGLCLGFAPTLDRREPEVLAAYETIVAKTRGAKKFPGIHNASVDYSAEMTAMGFQFHAVLSDGALLQRAATAQVEAFKANVPAKVKK